MKTVWIPISQMQNLADLNPHCFQNSIYLDSAWHVLFRNCKIKYTYTYQIFHQHPWKQKKISCRLFCLLRIFSKSTLIKNSFRNTIKVLNGLDPIHSQRFVRPDLGPNCLQRLSADNTSRQRIDSIFWSLFEPVCDKGNNLTWHPVKSQISLGIHPVC